MLPYLGPSFGNPASSHRFGREAGRAVEKARRQAAELIGASPEEIVFTGGATESNNLAIKGAAESRAGEGNHIITVVTEHDSVRESCRSLERRGFQVTWLPVGSGGLVDLGQLERALRKQTILITIMYANNEIGVIQPMARICRLAETAKALLHSDAAQAAGKIPLDVSKEGIDLLSLTAHKIHGPKGTGALYVRRGVELAPQMEGGGQERGLRSGTLNVAGIAGLGEACELCRLEMAEESRRVAGLRDRLREALMSQIEQCRVNGSLEHRLPQNLHVTIGGVDGDSLLAGLGAIAVSAGSACHSGGAGASHVLQALGHGEGLLEASIRFGLGRFTTGQEVDFAARRIVETVNALRGASRGVEAAGVR